jgi:hypothetical protein
MKATSRNCVAGIFAAALGLMASTANAALVISSGTTSNVVCTTGVCTATAASAVLNAGTLQNMLARSNTKVTTGTAAKDIVIAAPVRWPGRQELTLEAPRSIRINAEVTVAGNGAVTFSTANDSAPSFGSGGRLTFSTLTSALKINGRAYILVNSVESLAIAAEDNFDGAIAFAQDYDAAPDGVYPDSPFAGTFSGDFNGLGHTIKNFRLAYVGEIGEPPRVIGLFAQLGTGGTIENISLTDAQVSSVNNFGNLGLLVGQNRGAIDRVSVAGRVIGTPDANVLGGLVGFNVSTGTITNSRSGADIVDGFFSGGLVGFNQGEIFRSSATGTVTAQERLSTVGGLVGSSMTASGVGAVRARISQSFATGAVTSSGTFAFIGGLIADTALSTIVNCYATGPVSGTGASGERAIGGVIGNLLNTTLGATYATGAIRGVAGDRIGGVAGSTRLPNLRLIATNYWNRTTTGVTRGTGVGVRGFVGLTSAQLKARLPSGFNPAIWGQSPNVNEGFPFLKALARSVLTTANQVDSRRIPVPSDASLESTRRLELTRPPVALQPQARVRIQYQAP